MKTLYLILATLVFSLTIFGQRTMDKEQINNERMIQEERNNFDRFSKSVEAESFRLARRKRAEESTVNQTFQFKIKSDAVKIGDIFANSLKSSGFIIKNQTSSQISFDAGKFYSVAKFTGDSKSTNISVFIFSTSREPISQRRNEAHKLRDNIKLILKSVRQEAENRK